METERRNLNQVVHIKSTGWIKEAKCKGEKKVQEKLALGLSDELARVYVDEFAEGYLLGVESELCKLFMKGIFTSDNLSRAMGIEKDEIIDVLKANGYVYIPIEDVVCALEKRTEVAKRYESLITS